MSTTKFNMPQELQCPKADLPMGPSRLHDVRSDEDCSWAAVMTCLPTVYDVFGSKRRYQAWPASNNHYDSRVRESCLSCRAPNASGQLLLCQREL